MARACFMGRRAVRIVREMYVEGKRGRGRPK